MCWKQFIKCLKGLQLSETGNGLWQLRKAWYILSCLADKKMSLEGLGLGTSGLHWDV
jgi:hypothetical protein